MSRAAHPPRSRVQRRLPIGAELAPGGVHFRVWAPACRQVEVCVGERPAAPLDREPGGYFSGLVRSAAGDRYRYRLDGDRSIADPASRYQPEGPFGPSEVVDPSRFPWTDGAWPGPEPRGQVLYELHVGTFTPAGTWAAAAERLSDLAALGVTVVEVMPVADFPGRFGWGYDGVSLFAPTRLYGPPDAFRSFVDAAHGHGLGVILDVVYNHFGPAGNVLPELSPAYVSARHETDWGPAINFDGPDSGPVREFFLANVRHWIGEYHLDGFRFDATQDIHDNSAEPILAALADEARAAAGGRRVLLVGENEPQDTRLLRPRAEGGMGLDALWNDDFHHAAVVALTGRAEAYYSDYRGTSQELVSAAKHGFLYQGQHYTWQGKRRGTPTTGISRAALVNYLENHDQVANSERGARLRSLASPGAFRALTALLLLGPGTPLLFQGQEYGSTRPFLFFADHAPELAATVQRGRREFLRQFPTLAEPDVQEQIAEPHAPATFEACVLDPREREAGATLYQLHRDLLELRRRDPAFGAGAPDGVDGAVLTPEAFVLRFFPERGTDRLLLVNLGRDLQFSPAPEPLLAPPPARQWGVAWSSEAVAYGGRGVPPVETSDGWRIPGQCALVLEPVPLQPTEPQ